MQKQQNLFPTEKKRHFQESQGESGRELGFDCSAETKRELASGCMWEAQVPLEWAAIQQHWLTSG